MNRDRYNTGLPAKYLKYDPTDVLTFTDEDGVDRTVRLTQVALGNAYTVGIEGVLEDLDSYTSVTGGSPSTVPLDSLADPGPCRPVVMDIPLLRDSDSLQQRAVGLYTGFAAYLDSWSGGTMEISTDGVNFSSLDVNAADTPWGYLASAVAPADLEYLGTDDGLGEVVHWPAGAYRFDENASITVQFVQGGDDLSSATREQVLAGRNAVFVGGEIIQYSTVTAGSVAGEYILSDLIRGRRGTEYLMLQGHKYGTAVRALDARTLSLARFDIIDRGKNVQFRARSNGQIENTTNRESVILAGNTAVPYQVAFPTVDKIADGTARGPVTLSWNRRTRVGGEDDWMDGDVEIAVSERYTQFEVALLEKPAGEAATAIDGVVFTVTFTGSGEQPRIRVTRVGGSSWFTYGFAADDFVDLEFFGNSTGPDGTATTNTAGRYQIVTLSTFFIDLEGVSNTTGNVGAFPPGLVEVEGRVRTVQEEAQVWSTTGTSVSIATSDMTAAGYTDGDRLDIAIYQMFFPQADSNVLAGTIPTGERGRPINLRI